VKVDREETVREYKVEVVGRDSKIGEVIVERDVKKPMQVNRIPKGASVVFAMLAMSFLINDRERLFGSKSTVSRWRGLYPSFAIASASIAGKDRYRCDPSWQLRSYRITTKEGKVKVE